VLNKASIESLHLRTNVLASERVTASLHRGHRTPHAQAVLRALAEPKRVAILRLIRTRELAAGEIASRFKTTRPAISQHIRVLVRAGLVSERRDRTKRLYRVKPEGFAAVRSFLDTFWEDRLTRLKSAVIDDARRR
jgi:DNA-binding transcriptional ArsR family regulator